MNERKLVCFDVDGVVVSSEKTHFLSMQDSLLLHLGYYLEESIHNKISSLSTDQKIDWLSISEEITVDSETRKKIKKDKFNLVQKYKDHMVYNAEIKKAIDSLKDRCNFALVSNARVQYVEGIAKHLGFDEHILCIGNDSGYMPKPNPDMYIAAMTHFNTEPRNTVIFEDSDVGFTAAVASGATAVKVDSLEQMTERLVLNTVSAL